ncbi:MAG: hypothetical protein K2P81_17400 [Bacteriovoracaceae bacterium]|nr:hypothetical protein [Bacteriovoracaceae bacterium]
MKLFLASLLLVVSSAFASTVDSQSIRFDSSVRDGVVQLKAEKTHTEYRQDTVARTCYRTVYAGSRTVCRRPQNGPQQCWSEPVYRTVPYTCYETISTPYEVFDNYVDANVAVNFGMMPEGMSSAGNITATLNGDLLTLRANGTPNMIVELSSLQQNRRMNGNVLMIDAVASVKFHDALAVKRALNLNNASIKKSVLTYTLGPISNLQLGHSLKIVDSPLLGGDTTLFDAELGAALSRTERGSVTDMSIAFSDLLGRELGAGRFNITAKAFFKAGTAILNASEVGELSVEKTILYKIK